MHALSLLWILIVLSPLQTLAQQDGTDPCLGPFLHSLQTQPLIEKILERISKHGHLHNGSDSVQRQIDEYLAHSLSEEVASWPPELRANDLIAQSIQDRRNFALAREARRNGPRTWTGPRAKSIFGRSPADQIQAKRLAAVNELVQDYAQSGVLPGNNASDEVRLLKSLKGVPVEEWPEEFRKSPGMIEDIRHWNEVRDTPKFAEFEIAWRILKLNQDPNRYRQQFERKGIRSLTPNESNWSPILTRHPKVVTALREFFSPPKSSVPGDIGPSEVLLAARKKDQAAELLLKHRADALILAQDFRSLGVLPGNRSAGLGLFLAKLKNLPESDWPLEFKKTPGMIEEIKTWHADADQAGVNAFQIVWLVKKLKKDPYFNKTLFGHAGLSRLSSDENAWPTTLKKHPEVVEALRTYFHRTSAKQRQ